MITYINETMGEHHPEEFIFQYRNGFAKLWLDFSLTEDGWWDVYVSVSCAYKDSEYSDSIMKSINTFFIRADDFPKLWARKFGYFWNGVER